MCYLPAWYLALELSETLLCLCSNVKFICTLMSLFNENTCVTYTLGTFHVLGLCVKIAGNTHYLFLNCQERLSERTSIVCYLFSV